MNIVNKWILKVAPFLAPFPTAYVIYGSLMEILGWDWWVALIAAAVIEMIGFRSVGLLVEMYQFNRTCSAVETRMVAPLWQPILTVVVYFAAVLSLTIMLEIIPSAAIGTPISFAVMGLTGGWLAALTTDQDERANARMEQRRKAQEAKQASLDARKPRKSVADASQSASQGSQTATQTAQPAPMVAKVYACQWPGCVAELASPQAYAAHTMHHQRKAAKIYAETYATEEKPA